MRDFLKKIFSFKEEKRQFKFYLLKKKVFFLGKRKQTNSIVESQQRQTFSFSRFFFSFLNRTVQRSNTHILVNYLN